MRPFGKLEDSIPLDIGTVESITTNTTVIDNFYDMLTEAVRIRICNIPTLFSTISPTSTMPRLGILFSGGLDCMVLAALAHAHVPLYEPIDLLTVAFENPRVIEARAAREAAASLSKSKKQERLHRSRKQLPYVTLLNQGDDARGNTTDIHSSKIVAAVPSSAHVLSNSSKTPYDDVPDRITARQGVSELRNRYPNRKWNLVEVDVSHAEMSKWKAHVIGLTKPSDSVMDLVK